MAKASGLCNSNCEIQIHFLVIAIREIARWLWKVIHGDACTLKLKPPGHGKDVG